ncbi:hypothetical protein DFP73DRAFT_583836 [Morchella snyderi]|nr:hypothetical protein DFP73DRAFT_583836 [Morchella snyderi]
MSSCPNHDTDSKVPGGPVPIGDSILQTAASITQDFTPIKNICAHLNAFHIYADDPSRKVETNHYCSHVSSDVRQCLLYDSNEPNARLIGIEYMITPPLYETLPAAERALWHSHVFEVKSGQLIMPCPRGVPLALWEKAETKEMEGVITLYGKTYHLWQVDRGDRLPMGEPKLMMATTEGSPHLDEMMKLRDERWGVASERKRVLRKGIVEPRVHPDADQYNRSKLT